MTGPPLSEDDLFAKARKLREAGVPLSEIDAYLTSKRSAAPVDTNDLQMRMGATSDNFDIAQLQGRDTGNLAQKYIAQRDTLQQTRAKNPVRPPEEEEPSEPGYGGRLVRTVLNAGRGFAPLEAVMAGAGAAGSRLTDHPLSYRESLNTLREETDRIPAGRRTAGQAIGGGVAAAMIPGGPALQGARFGIAQGLGTADPENVEERLHSAASKGVLGALAGKAGDLAGKGIRVARSPSVGATALRRGEEMASDDAVNYGKSSHEARMHMGGNKEIVDVLKSQNVKPFADVVRSSETHAGKTPIQILHETYPHMSERQGAIRRGQITNPADYKAGTTLESKDIGLAKERMLGVADKVTPSFRPAINRHAELSGELDAFNSASDVADKVLKHTQPVARNLENPNLSPEAFKASIPGMVPGEARAATEGLLGESKGKVLQGSFNPLRGFGLPGSAMRINRLSPLMNALDEQSGAKTPLVDALRAAGIWAGTSP